MAKTTPDTPPIWERQEGETPKAYEAFCLYRDMKDVGDPQSTRSLSKVANQLQKSDTLIGRWSRTFDWVKRAAARDDDIERKIREEEEKQRLKDIRDMRKRHAKLAMDVLDKVADAVREMDTEEIKPGNIPSMIAEASKLERISRGDAGEVIEERVDGQAAPVVTFYMPSNHRDKPIEDDAETDDGE